MDIWDWFASLKRWWWMLIVFPVLAAAITWVASPKPLYESTWTINIFFDEPSLTNSPGYIDFVLLDDFDLLMRTGALGDVMYLRMPENVQQSVSREDFGEMFSSSRKANFVGLTVRADDPELVTTVANTLNDNLTEVTNLYLVPPDYRFGPANVNVLDPVSEPELNTRDRLVNVGAITLATLLVSLGATGVAEWLRLSRQAKYAAK